MLQSLLNNAASLYSCDLIKKTPTQVFSGEYYKIFKNNYFENHLRTGASGDCILRVDALLLIAFFMMTTLIFNTFYCIK